MKIHSIFLLFVGTLSLSGCLGPILGATAGAGAGATLQDDPLVTAGAAGVGALAGAGIDHSVKRSKEKEFKRGYDLGTSDKTKELYWIRQREQQNLNNKEPDPELSVVPIYVPKHTNAWGQVKAPATYEVPVYETN